MVVSFHKIKDKGVVGITTPKSWKSPPKLMDKKSAMMKPKKRSKTKGKDDDGTRKSETYWPTKKVKKSKNKTRRKQ